MINRYSAELDIGTLVDIGSGSIYQNCIGAIKNIAFNDLEAKYIYEVDLGNGLNTHCFASDLMPVTAIAYSGAKLTFNARIFNIRRARI